MGKDSKKIFEIEEDNVDNKDRQDFKQNTTENEDLVEILTSEVNGSFDDEVKFEIESSSELEYESQDDEVVFQKKSSHSVEDDFIVNDVSGEEIDLADNLNGVSLEEFLQEVNLDKEEVLVYNNDQQVSFQTEVLENKDTDDVDSSVGDEESTGLFFSKNEIAPENIDESHDELMDKYKNLDENEKLFKTEKKGRFGGKKNHSEQQSIYESDVLSKKDSKIVVYAICMIIVIVGIIGFGMYTYNSLTKEVSVSTSQSGVIGNKGSNSTAVVETTVPKEVEQLQNIIQDRQSMPIVPDPVGSNDPFQPILAISNDIQVSETDTAFQTAEKEFIEWIVRDPNQVDMMIKPISTLYKNKTKHSWVDLINQYKEKKTVFKTVATTTDNTGKNTSTTTYSTDSSIPQVFDKSSGGYSLDVFRLQALNSNQSASPLTSVKVSKLFYDSDLNLYAEMTNENGSFYVTIGDQIVDGYFLKEIDFSRGMIVALDSKSNQYKMFVEAGGIQTLK